MKFLTIHLAVVFLMIPSPGSAQESSATPLRTPGQISLHAGVGSVNGARLGTAIVAIPAVSAEFSVGYLSIGLLKPDQSKENTDGVSFTIGGNWYSHPESEISPMVTLLASYITTIEAQDGYVQHRFAISPAIGTEYYMTSALMLFFRFGMSVQFISEPTRTSTEVPVHFDAGIGWSF